MKENSQGSVTGRRVLHSWGPGPSTDTPMAGRSLVKASLGRGIGAKAHISFLGLKVRKIGAHGWTQLVRGKGELKLRGFGTLGGNFDHKSSRKP